jgi:hypothetical protein
MSKLKASPFASTSPRLSIIEPGCSFRPDTHQAAIWSLARSRATGRQSVCASTKKTGRIPLGKTRHSRPFWSSDEKVVLDQFHGDFTHEYIPEEGLRWARPFVIGSAGATRVAGGANNSFIRFSFGLGGGIKVYFTRHLGFRMQGEWLPLVVEPEVTSFVCGGGCIVHLSARLVSQGEIVIGPVLRF